MYIPKHQYEIKTILDTEGRLQYEDGTPFGKSSYVELSNGLRYDVPADDLAKGIFDRAKKILAPTDFRDPKLSLNFLSAFIPTRPLGKTSIQRYFMKHKVTGKIVEIDLDTYSFLDNNRPSHIEVAQTTWHTAGPLYDINTLNITQEGTVTKNTRQLDELEKSISGIKSYVTDLTFLSDPQYKDQRPQPASTNIILPSPS